MASLQFIVVQNQRHKIQACFILFLVGTWNLFAQYPQVRERIKNLPQFDDRFVHYGYFVGLNNYFFDFDYDQDYYRSNNLPDIEVNSGTGFTIGLIGDLRINQFLNLRLEPGLYYSQRDLLYPDIDAFNTEQERIREIKSTYIHLPLLLKINAQRINNFRPFLLAGVSSDFNLSSNKKNTDDNFSNVFRTQSQNINYEIGVGFDFYLFYFKFSPSIRGIFSTQNELIPDNSPNSPWTGPITNMVSRGVVFNLVFE